MSIATINRTQVHYEALGHGQPVLFLHGWIGSWRYWWPAMQGLAAQYRAFALDLWGFGDSANAASRYTLAANTRLVADFIDELAITTPIALVGHGLGAAVALRFAAAHPAVVERLVCVALPVAKQAPDAQTVPFSSDELLKRVFGRGTPYPELGTELHKTDQRAVANLVQEVQAVDFTAELTTLPAPTLSIYGRRDPLAPPPSSLDGITHQQIVLDDCNHFPMLEAPATFNRMLLDFLHAGGEPIQIEPKAYWQRRVR